MNLIKSLTAATFTTLISAYAAAATPSSASFTSPIQDPNYVCVHTEKPEALVFKTTSPQKVWRTPITKSGKFKKGKAFEFQKLQINAAAINIEGKVASFKAELAKNYEVKGLFEKQTDEDIRLTVVSNYTIDKGASQRKDNYNCQLEKSDAPPILLGSAE